MMLTGILIYCFVYLSLPARPTISVVCDDNTDFNDVDIFQAAKLFGLDLGVRTVIGLEPHGQYGYQIFEEESEISKLNNLLIERTDSVDPQANFNVVLDELIKYYKNNGEFDSREAQAKRLFLALQTLKGDHLCDHYGLMIAENNWRAIGTEVGQIVRSERLRRVDKILAHFIRERIDKCVPIYLENFDRIVPDLDKTLMARLDRIFGNFILKIKTDKSLKFVGTSEAEKLYALKGGRPLNPYKITAANIYDALKDLAKDDEDVRYLKPVENERTGFPGIKKDKFGRLFEDYIAEPCKYFRGQFKKDVFAPLQFDQLFGHEIQKDRPDFYEAWYKYELCFSAIQSELFRVAEYAHNKHN